MTTTAASTLTDRYVEATLRRLPGRQRADIERELRTSIADAVDERLEAGAEAADAELAVLTELGDPARLAAGYADRPLHLIGPALFVEYSRLLRMLVVTVVPAVTVAVGFIRAVQGDTAGSVVSAAIETAITVTVHIGFWTTLLFALVERRPNWRHGLRPAPWTPSALPEPPSRRKRYVELISETVALVVFTSLILVSPALSIDKDADGDPIGILSPWLWDNGVVYVFIAVVIVSLGFSYAKYYLRWNLALGVTGTLVNLVPPVMMIWLARTDHVLNPAFVEAVGWPTDATDWINRGLVALGVITVISTVVEAVRQARRPVR